MIYIILFDLIIATAFFDAVMDAIKDLRVHLARHPFADFWHGCKHLMRLCLLGCGYVTPRAFSADWIAASIACACGLVIGKLVWDATYAPPEFWLFCDESIHFGTGWKWLDKVLGFHW